MDARELREIICYLGQERDARKIVVEEKLAPAEKVALMTNIEVYEVLLKKYEVVSIGEDIKLVAKENMETYKNIVKNLSR